MFERIREIISEQLNIENPETLKMDTNLLEDLDADSLDAVEIIMNIEEEFEIKIPDEEIDNVKTIGDIISLIESNR
ncbi:MAG: acyl carrier protein [Peptostreptococcus porci]|uniref:Acyl carrier protein n=1 Tax=Peptostreptococcus porci TaxID=2652282 RepID=A0A6N7X563_9FIRM|nr:MULTISPECIES: acyl carrier protein [Peptostreptococcus]MDD7182280.1 acyl carrier protein [Peptostreptococcus porci]MDY2794384.1 acyl carrier protein [Peptostreptococcus porci]MDY5479134.1 acyl carrier protein [Peptostreptococcus porci]MST63201.1 acyl carrier protein [Peptostreptococcus porci]SFE50970.1 acyl carrier protein [Peptostreptococcus sp. D1]